MRLAKYLKLSMIVLFVLMIGSACQNNQEGGLDGYISLDELTDLSEKGNTLDWSDLNKYSFEDTGSGLYIRNYPIEGGRRLVLTGRSLESPPERVYVVNQSGKELDFNPDSMSEWSR
ncbi:hypothetical protein [Paenibacillus sp. FSL R10-2736]|uniref:hypothetical protein n=1 Tax=Paenibacillus sp. FSL R10-2736 TaxID=2954692 RepID=UPI0030F58F27